MKLARDIMSLSTFKRDSNKVMRQMKKTKEPLVLTVNGKPAVVVQDAESYQKLLELKERSEVVEILCQRLASRSRKNGRPAEDSFNEFFAKNNIPVEGVLCTVKGKTGTILHVSETRHLKKAGQNHGCRSMSR